MWIKKYLPKYDYQSYTLHLWKVMEVNCFLCQLDISMLALFVKILFLELLHVYTSPKTWLKNLAYGTEWPSSDIYF